MRLTALAEHATSVEHHLAHVAPAVAQTIVAAAEVRRSPSVTDALHADPLLVDEPGRAVVLDKELYLASRRGMRVARLVQQLVELPWIAGLAEALAVGQQ